MQPINSGTKQTHFSLQCVFSGTTQTLHFGYETYRDIKKSGFDIWGCFIPGRNVWEVTYGDLSY
jgi:hypothetical protein